MQPKSIIAVKTRDPNSPPATTKKKVHFSKYCETWVVSMGVQHSPEGQKRQSSKAATTNTTTKAAQNQQSKTKANKSKSDMNVLSKPLSPTHSLLDQSETAEKGQVPPPSNPHQQDGSSKEPSDVFQDASFSGKSDPPEGFPQMNLHLFATSLRDTVLEMQMSLRNTNSITKSLEEAQVFLEQELQTCDVVYNTMANTVTFIKVSAEESKARLEAKYDFMQKEIRELKSLVESNASKTAYTLQTAKARASLSHTETRSETAGSTSQAQNFDYEQINHLDSAEPAEISAWDGLAPTQAWRETVLNSPSDTLISQEIASSFVASVEHDVRQLASSSTIRTTELAKMTIESINSLLKDIDCCLSEKIQDSEDFLQIRDHLSNLTLQLKAENSQISLIALHLENNSLLGQSANIPPQPAQTQHFSPSANSHSSQHMNSNLPRSPLHTHMHNTSPHAADTHTRHSTYQHMHSSVGPSSSRPPSNFEQMHINDLSSRPFHTFPSSLPNMPPPLNPTSSHLPRSHSAHSYRSGSCLQLPPFGNNSVDKQQEIKLLPELKESEKHKIKTYLDKVFTLTGHLQLSEDAYFQLLIFKLPNKLSDAALQFKKTKSLEEFVAHVIQAYDNEQSTFEIKQQVKLIQRDQSNLLQLLATSTELIDTLRDRLPEHQFQYMAWEELRNILYRSISRENILHLQQYEIDNPNMSSQQLYHLAHSFELRVQIADKLSAKTPYSNMKVQEDPESEADESEQDSNQEHTGMEDEINQMMSNRRPYKPRQLAYTLTNTQFYDRSLHAFIDLYKNKLCDDNPIYRPVQKRYNPVFPPETQNLKKSKVQEFWGDTLNCMAKYELDLEIKKGPDFRTTSAYRDIRKLRDVLCRRHRNLLQTSPNSPMHITVKTVCDDLRLESNLLQEYEVNNAVTHISRKAPLRFLPVQIQTELNIPALVDTGCTSTCVSSSLAEKLQLTREPSAARISGAFKEAVSPIEGTTNLTLHFISDQNEPVAFQLNALIVKNLSHPVFLGMDILSGPHIQKITNSGLFLLKPKSIKLAFIHKEDLNHLNSVETPSQEDFFQDNYLIECNALQDIPDGSSSPDNLQHENPDPPPTVDPEQLDSPTPSHSSEAPSSLENGLSASSSLSSMSSLHSEDSASSLSSVTVVVDMNRHVLAVDVSETSAVDNIFMTVSKSVEFEAFQTKSITLRADTSHRDLFGRFVELTMFENLRSSLHIPPSILQLSHSGTIEIDISNTTDSILILLPNVPIARIIKDNIPLLNDSSHHYIQHLSIMQEMVNELPVVTERDCTRSTADLKDDELLAETNDIIKRLQRDHVVSKSRMPTHPGSSSTTSLTAHGSFVPLATFPSASTLNSNYLDDLFLTAASPQHLKDRLSHHLTNLHQPSTSSTLATEVAHPETGHSKSYDQLHTSLLDHSKDCSPSRPKIARRSTSPGPMALSLPSSLRIALLSCTLLSLLLPVSSVPLTNKLLPDVRTPKDLDKIGPHPHIFGHDQDPLSSTNDLTTFMTQNNFSSSPIHSGGLLFIRSQDRLRLQDSSITIKQSVSLDHLLTDMEDWTILIHKSRRTLHQLSSNLTRLPSSLQAFASPTMAYKSVLWKARISASLQNLNGLHNQYMLGIADLLKAYDNLIPFQSDNMNSSHLLDSSSKSQLLRLLPNLTFPSVPFQLLSHSGLSSLLSNESFPSLSSINPDLVSNLLRFLKFTSNRTVKGADGRHPHSKFKHLSDHFRAFQWPAELGNANSSMTQLDSLLLLDTVSDIHNQQDILNTFHAFLTASLSLVASNVQSSLTHKLLKIKANKQFLRDLYHKKSIAQSTSLRMTFMAAVPRNQIARLLSQPSIDSITPRTSISNGLLQIEYPIDLLESHTFDLSISRIVPFHTDDGTKISQLPSIAKIQSGQSHHFLLMSDFVHCQRAQNLLICPRHILDTPLTNPCFQAHIQDDFLAIQMSCSLSSALNPTSLFQLDNGLAYFNLPPGSVVETWCDTPSEISLHGTGLITIPWGCSLTHGLTVILNLNTINSVNTQHILYIASESLISTKSWRSYVDLKLTSLTTLVSLLCSLLVTQCTNICLYLGFCRKNTNPCCAFSPNTELTTQVPISSSPPPQVFVTTSNLTHPTSLLHYAYNSHVAKNHYDIPPFPIPVKNPSLDDSDTHTYIDMLPVAKNVI
jgi:hypothetical protein